MTITTDQALDKLGDHYKSLKTKTKMSTMNIYDGVLERFMQRNSLTPKQALWTYDNLSMAGIPIPMDFKQYIELPGTETQKTAYSKVIDLLPDGPDVNDKAIEDIMSGGHTLEDLKISKTEDINYGEQAQAELQTIRNSVMKLNDLLVKLDS